MGGPMFRKVAGDLFLSPWPNEGARTFSRREAEQPTLTAHLSRLQRRAEKRWLLLAAEMAGLVSGNRPSSPAGWACLPRVATRTFGADAASVHAARSFTLATLRRWDRTERGQDIVIVVSELVTNALRHALPGAGDTRPRRPIQLGLLQLGPCVLCAVADPSRAVPAPRVPGSLGETGRGLHIICALSDQWGCTAPGDTGKAVWATFYRRSPAPALPGHTGAVPETSKDDEPDSAPILQSLRALHERLDALEHRMVPRERPGRAEPRHPAPDDRAGFVPAWKRPTEGEARWQAAIAVAAAVALQFPLPGRLVLLRPVWLMPALQGLLLLGLVMANPRRINRESRAIRLLSLALAAVLSLANAWSVARLVSGLVQGTEGNTAGPLLATGGVIWLTNVIVFALWYWEFDRGGPAARAHATRVYPDFMFVQMTSPHLAPTHWEPMFGDYLYLSFTNATAFSPTDVMPLSRWAKMAMTVQASISIVTVALVVARAVNILR